MARFRHIDSSPRFLAVNLQRQLLPGTFGHAMNHLIDNELDLTGFDARFKNDLTRASAYPPAMLLKAVLYAYSLGITSGAPAATTSLSSRCPATAGRTSPPSTGSSRH